MKKTFGFLIGWILKHLINQKSLKEKRICLRWRFEFQVGKKIRQTNCKAENGLNSGYFEGKCVQNNNGRLTLVPWYSGTSEIEFQTSSTHHVLLTWPQIPLASFICIQWGQNDTLKTNDPSYARALNTSFAELKYIGVLLFIISRR